MQQRPILEAGDIQRLLAAATQEANENSWAVSIAVVDEGGHLLAFSRLPGAAPSSAQIAIDKARSAALTRRPTHFFADMLNAGQLGAASLHGVIPMAGGLPLIHGAHALGGIAASGVKAEFDARIAAAGRDALGLDATF
ncbi:GlcG/HbpS family heme-binding protein [Pseudomonas aeruginosa]|uniref:GlcG/HbpS family heme-binding protein n=1 Tax=Pseudomonas aeruginosa TaxID=287 RepID=UPI000EB09E3B|nr:heme-binding protein [Pseudomonas aeruginosa]HBO3146298.1 heme-binding protein [Pseudomonas aeruginosa]HCL4166292.1 heme-binding protein [Pseudomonas aeruginosa]